MENESPTRLSDMPPVELRVLHGPQAGSRLPVEAGIAYSIGSGDECAVLLAGAQVEADHAVLEADTGGVRVAARQGKVLAGGQEVAGSASVPFGAVLQLGKVKLCIDYCDAPWPGDEDVEQALAANVILAEEPQTPADAGETPAGAAPPQAVPARRKAPRLLAGAALLAVLACLTAVAALSSQAGDAPAEPEVGEAGLPPAEITVMPRTPAQRLEDVAGVLASLRQDGALELRAQAGPGGTLRITGSAESPARAEAAMAAIRAAVADAEPLEPAVLTRSQLREKFLDDLRGAGLAGRLKPRQLEPEMVLEGSLGPAERARFERMFQDFTGAHGGVLVVRAFVRDESTEVAVGVVTIVGGVFPSVITAAGHRVGPGGVLEGRVISAIRDGEVLFADGMRMRYSQ